MLGILAGGPEVHEGAEDGAVIGSIGGEEEVAQGSGLVVAPGDVEGAARLADEGPGPATAARIVGEDNTGSVEG
jgi:hypothetical protein